MMNRRLLAVVLASLAVTCVVLMAVVSSTAGNDESSFLLSVAPQHSRAVAERRASTRAVNKVHAAARAVTKAVVSIAAPVIKFATHTTQLVPIKPPPLPVPWSAPDNLFVFWGPEVDKTVTGENLRHTIKVGNIIAGRYQSPNFIYDLEGQAFRDLTLTCCAALLFPPLDHGFPVYQEGGRIAHRISRFVANGNTMIFTGDLTSLLFINTIFQYNLEPVRNNYSPGPFVQYEPKKLPKEFKDLPDELEQENTEVSVVHKFSLPVGTQVYYASPHGSPFFSIKYCEVMNPHKGKPPIKVSPTSCPKWKKKGVECGCGLIIFVGQSYEYDDNEKWNAALRATLTLSIGKDES